MGSNLIREDTDLEKIIKLHGRNKRDQEQMEMSQAEETGTLRLSQDTALTGLPGGSSLYDFISGFSTWHGSHLE